MNEELVAKALEGIHPEYMKILSTDNKDLLSQTLTNLNKAISNDINEITPNPQDIFAAFRLCPWDKLKVVILGMDPYPKVGDAMGLSFSVPTGVKIPHSLNAIYKCLAKSGLIQDMPKHGNLSSWAEQGVLLLNTSLTTKKGKSGAHLSIWKQYTTKIIEAIAAKKQEAGVKLIFMLWGNDAQSFAANLDKFCQVKEEAKNKQQSQQQHVLLKWGHPSPLSPYNKNPADPKNFINCNHFTECNNMLAAENRQPINWMPLAQQ